MITKTYLFDELFLLLNKLFLKLIQMKYQNI